MPEIDQVNGHERPKTPLLWPYRGRDQWLRPNPHANVRQITFVIRFSCQARSYIAS